MNNKMSPNGPEKFSKATVEDLFREFKTGTGGISSAEARRRLDEYGANEPARKKKRTALRQFLSKFLNPLVVVLVIIGSFSYYFGQTVSAFLVLLMILLSVILSFVQEYRSGREAEKLGEMVRATAAVIRGGRKKEVRIRDIVPGDLVDLSAGDMIPADLRIISSKDLFINQAALTGESFPIEKFSEGENIAFMGSSVVSGTATGLVLRTGGSTQFGELAKRLTAISETSAFDRGIRQFIWLMIRFMLLLTCVIFAINALIKGDIMQALLFSLAVAVGLTPEMLPMIVAINLSKGAIAMSKKKVIVKRLNSIQNLGAMDILCTDKTGTLTMDKVVLEKHCDVVRKDSEEVLKLAYLNSYYQTGLKNLLDKAILKHAPVPVAQFKKIDEIPFDFSRRIMSVAVEHQGGQRLISKGAPEEVFTRCTHYELDGEVYEMESIILADLKAEYEKLSAEGFRVLAACYKDITEKKSVYSKQDETGMVLAGYLAFLDPPKPTVKKTIKRLQRLGIRLIVLTGDNDLVTRKICMDVGLDMQHFMTGDRLEALSDEVLKEQAKTLTVFARLSPLQKERVIRALHANGHVVGFLGDGINDAPSLKAADVGISVNNAVDIAKESADIILLEKSLYALSDGVMEGRRTFGNTMKYIRMGASSNLGNMISMTGASLFLPFLPMAPIQILLNNMLYDISQVAIPTDNVDEEYLERPKPWNIGEIRKFMMVFGPVSSIFDFITFAVLMFFFKASEIQFHTGWFLESLCTQTIIIHIIRTGKVPFIESRPSRFMVFMSFLIVSVGVVLTVTPVGPHFGFERPSAAYFLTLIGILVAYIFVTQRVKQWYAMKFGY